jgi:hypothetical protein
LKVKFTRDQNFRDAVFMGIMRSTFYSRLKKIYPNVKNTYGYLTKNTRIANKLPKEHRVDPRCISSNPLATPLYNWYYIKQVRKHNRQIHKVKILKGGIRKNNQAPYEVKGFRLFDKVSFKDIECFVFGRRSTGYFDIRLLDGTSIHKSAKFSELKLLQRAKGLLIENRKEKG